MEVDPTRQQDALLHFWVTFVKENGRINYIQCIFQLLRVFLTAAIYFESPQNHFVVAVLDNYERYQQFVFLRDKQDKMYIKLENIG